MLFYGNVLKPATKKQLKEWVAALRSGKYKQGRGELGTAKKGYCCLGLANRLFKFRKKSDCGLLNNDSAWNPQFTFLPEHIQRKLVKMNDGDIDVKNGKSYGKSFSEIADWIEENLINK